MSELFPQLSGRDRSGHTCHAIGCSTPVPPRLFMCAPHWRMVPMPMQRAVWKAYSPGQEDGLAEIRAEYFTVTDEAERAVRDYELAVAEGGEILALTFQQPWGTAVMGYRDDDGRRVVGPKRIENRGWRRKVPKGGLWIAVHAGYELHRAPVPKIAAIWPLLPSVAKLPRGAVLGAMRVKAWVRLDDDHVPAIGGLRLDPWAMGPYCALVDAVAPLETPLPTGGARGLWVLPAAILRALQGARTRAGFAA